jgi:signal transduction histidine kinase
MPLRQSRTSAASPSDLAARTMSGNRGDQAPPDRTALELEMRPAAVRPVIVAAMLGLTGVLAAVLTAQAVSAARYHRVTAERVLHDYASLGAEAVAQRLKAALNGRFSTVLLAAAATRGPAPISAASLQTTLPATARDVLDDSSRIIRVTPSDSLAPLLRKATTALPAYAYFGLTWIPSAHETDLLVFQPFRENTAQAMAFTLSERSASALITRISAKDPVLPASITHGASLDSGIGLRVTTAHGVLVNRGFDESSPFRARLALDQPYGDLGVEVSLSEWLAPFLVIGGLPRSRVPLLLTLLLLTVALTIAAGDQLRRELQLSRLREDFVSSVSHELRTPLAQIRMFAETLRLGRVRSPEEGERSLAIVENEARRLEHLVENLLHFSRAERRELHIRTESTNLTSLVQEIVAEFVPLAARTASTFVLELTPDVRTHVDPSAIRQIVLNLLDNAVKYGRAGQAITVRLSSTADVIRLEIEDQGAGITAHERARVWERFWRSESAREAGVTGTGVGLAIVRDLVRLHGGIAAVESSADGGARIVIDLPRTGE